MKRCLTLFLVVLIAGWLSVDEGFGRGGGGRGGGGGGGGGGRGGGGRGGGGGGGGFRGGSPGGGFSGGGRPASRPAGGGGGGRVAGGGANRGPSFSSPGGGRPGGGVAGGGRPGGGVAGGGRPGGMQPGSGPGMGLGNRPQIGSGGRPGAGQLPSGGIGGGNRPGIGQGSGIGSGVGSGIGSGPRPGVGSGIASGARPGTLPGLGTGAGLGSGTGLGSGNRGQNLGSRQDRAAGLQDRMANGDRMNMGERQGQRQDNRGERQGQRQDSRGDRQQNRQNWAGEHHGDWYHGAWGGGWYPGAMFANYPVAAALGLTWWGVNRLAYGFGMGGYSNPYCDEGGGGGGYDYSQPVAAYDPAAYEQPAATDAAATTTAAPATTPGVTSEGMALFDQARAAFAQGNYSQALDLCNQTLKTMPNDAAVHEFRSLTLFALKNFRESAAAAYAVLSAGPGWDWTTLSTLYGNVADYTTQLRELEGFVKQNPKSSDGHFLLAYHYLTMGHPDNAKSQLKIVDQLTPNDKLVRALLGMSASAGQEAATPTPQPPLDADKLIKAEQLVGVWTAGGSGGSTFQMTLEKDNGFSWKYTTDKKSQEIRGIFAVEQNNLALEVSDGSVMLAEIKLTGNQLKFKVIGGEEKDPGLTFTRAK